MSYTERLLDSAKLGFCPGCGPTLQEISSLYSHKGTINKYCTCCGWVAWAEFSEDGELVSHSFSSMPPDIDGEVKFDCATQYPEHRANWPRPEKDETPLDEYSELENKQYINEMHPEHFLVTENWTCSLCNAWAPHQVVDRRLDYTILDLNQGCKAALCCKHFISIFGQNAHQYYDEIYEPVILEDIE